MKIGERIRTARNNAGLSQLEVANRLGVSEASIRLYELGKRTPKPEMIERIADALDVEPQSLVEMKIESSRDALEMLFRLEDEFGAKPNDDGSLSFDAKAPGAKKLKDALKVWAKKQEELESGKIAQAEYDEWKAKFQS